MSEFIVQHTVEIRMHGVEEVEEDLRIGVGHDRQEAIVDTIRVALRLHEEEQRGLDFWEIELFAEFTEIPDEGEIEEHEERNLLIFNANDFSKFRHPLNYLIQDEEKEAIGALDSISDLLGLETPASVQRILDKNYEKCHPNS